MEMPFRQWSATAALERGTAAAPCQATGALLQPLTGGLFPSAASEVTDSQGAARLGAVCPAIRYQDPCPTDVGVIFLER